MVLRIVACALVLTIASVAHAQEQPPEPGPVVHPIAKVEKTATQRALELHDDAKILYAKGQYDEAVAKLRQAVKIDPEGKILFYNLGLIQEKMGNLNAAIADYRRCLELESDHDEKVHIARIIKRLEGARHYAKFEAGDDSAPVARAAPRQQSDAAPEDDGVSAWVWVGAGAAAASFVVAGVLAARASAVDPGDEARTDLRTSLSDLEESADDAHALAIGADVMLSVGIVLTAATITIALVTIGDHDGGTALRVGPTGALLDGRF